MNTTKKQIVQSKLDYSRRENEARQKIADLVDLSFEAYLKAGYPMESYRKSQYFMNLLFQSVNQLDPYSEERMGGLKLIIRFMQRLVDFYNTSQADETIGV